MESDLNWQMKALINELTQGMELTKQLRGHLNSTSSAENREILLQKILSSYEKALLILKWGKPMGQPQLLASITGVPESPVSGDGSLQSEEFDWGFKDHQEQIDVSKKRKVLPTWTDQVKICSENGLEGPTDDGYSWRKYGQKDILGTKYPRSYYRCTYRSTQNCWATKQVQRSDDDPTVFEIIYRGRHTCHLATYKAPTPTSPNKQSNHPNDHQKQPPSQNMLFHYRTSLRVNTEDLDSRGSENPSFAFSTLVNDGTYRSFSPSFVSPAASETSHFSSPQCQMNKNSFGLVHNLPHLESDLTEIISGNTSATNSPIVDLHSFSIDPVNLNPSFPFTSGFFS